MLEAWGPAPGKLFVNDDERDRAGHDPRRQHRADDPAAPRLRREPGRDLPRSRHGAVAPLPGRLPLGGAGVRRSRRRPPRQARLDGVAAGQERRAVGVLRHRRRDRQPAADLPVPRQRPGRGCAGQAPCARHDRRPPDPADGARGVVRRHRQARAAARRVRQHRRDGPGQAAGDPRRRSGPTCGPRRCTATWASTTSRTRTTSTTSSSTSTAGCARSRTHRSATACTCSARRPRARRGSTSCCRSCGRARSGAARPARSPDCAPRSACKDGSQPRRRSTRSRSRPGPWSRRMEDADWDAGHGVEHLTDVPDVVRVLEFAADRGRAAAGEDHRRARPRAARARRRLHPGRPVAARRCAAWSTCCRPAATSTPSTPRPCRRALAWETGRAMADSLIERYLADTGDYPRSVGPLGVGHVSAMRTSGDDIAEVLALIGVEPEWDPASRRVNGLRVDPARRARPSAHRRDGPHLRLLPRRVPARGRRCSTTRSAWSPSSTSRTTRTTYARTRSADLADHGDQRRATTRIFGSKPGSYGAGILPVIEAGNWRDDKDLAEVYTAWGGFAYGRDLDGAPARRRHARQLQAHRGRREEHRHPRARHRRLRRLLPVPRRHGRHRPRADRHGPQGVRRRLDDARRRTHADPAGGDDAGVPRPRRQPAVDRRDAAARLQGCVRARRDGRLPLRLRRHDRRRRTTGCTRRSPRSTCSTRSTRSS